MRKKMNYQKTDYAQNGELLCFGLSEHSLTENMPRLSAIAQKDAELISGMFKDNEDILTRPAYKSNWNDGVDINRAKLRFLLGALVIRELPIRSFAARSVIVYFYFCYFLNRGLGRGITETKPAIHFLAPYVHKALMNRPDFFDLACTRILPRIPITVDPHKEWRLRQQPVYHQYHRTTYRYRLRKPRYVPWDGTMHQPIMPFLVDDKTDVINGTFRRNPNTNPEFK